MPDTGIDKLNEMLDSRESFKKKHRRKAAKQIKRVYNPVIDYNNPYREPLFHRVPSNKSVKSVRVVNPPNSELVDRRISEFTTVYGNNSARPPKIRVDDQTQSHRKLTKKVGMQVFGRSSIENGTPSSYSRMSNASVPPKRPTKL